MKKFMTVLLSGAMVCMLLAGCNNGGNSGGGTAADNSGDKAASTADNNAASSGEKVTLTVWGDLDNQAVLEDAFDEINSTFAAENPNINLEYEWSGTIESINVAIQSDSLPDIFWVQGNKSTVMAELARGGYILNLDDYNLDASRYPQSSINYATVDGSVYCSYPGFCDYVCVYYNVDMFDELGLEKPETYDEMLACMEALKAAGTTPLSLGGNGEFDRYWLAQLMAPAFANDTLGELEEGSSNVDYSGLKDLFEQYRMFCEKGYMGKDFVNTDGVGAQLAFTNGQAGMLVDGTWSNSLYKDLDFEVACFAMPDPDGTRWSQTGEAQYNTYAISSKCQYPDEAIKYLKFLNTAKAEQMLENQVGNIPLCDDVTGKDDFVAQLADFDEVGYNIYHVLSHVATDTAAPQDLLLGSVLPKLMMQEITADEAVKIISDEVDKAK